MSALQTIAEQVEQFGKHKRTLYKTSGAIEFKVDSYLLDDETGVIVKRIADSNKIVYVHITNIE